MKGLILCAAPEWDDAFARSRAQEADCILCADGGYLRALSAGIEPDVLMGDFDSCDIAQVEELEKIVYPTRKDDTDLILALRYMAKRGYTDVEVLGCFGGRQDHALGNIQSVLFGLTLGLRVTLLDPRNRIFAVTEGVTEIEREENAYVSFLCVGAPCEGITLEGFSYPLQDATLTAEYPLGVSNEIVAEKAHVTIKKGTLLCIIAKKE
jgi:thiamine pyrophosphokinase